MTLTVSQTVLSPWLTPVRLASTSNIAGTYSNGPTNNGVGATLTIAASSLTIDSVVCAVGDRVLLQTQTATYEQGIYIVKAIASTVILERSDDQQSIEQMKAGQYVSVGAGSVGAGNFYSLVEPLPQFIGVDAIVFNSDPSAGGVSFSGPASTANALAVFSNTSGDIKAASTTTTLGQALNITGALGVTGAITASTNITATAGTITSSAGNIVGVNSSSSATPGTVRNIYGKMTLSNATYANTTNSVAGVRGEVDMVGGSSGYVYGVQGKVIPTGTLSGSIWAPAVFGQYDLSGATINAGQIAAVWGDMGATGGTFTDVTGARMFAGTNTIASLTLNSMIYLYGKATNLFELSGSSSTYISAGAATPSGTIKKLAITIDGVTYYILAATVWS